MHTMEKLVLALFLAVLLLLGAAPTSFAADSAIDPEGNSFEEAYPLQFTGSTMAVIYSGEFCEGERTDFFKIQAPNFDVDVCFYLHHTSRLTVNLMYASGGIREKTKLYIYDSDFQEIGYAYEGTSYSYQVQYPNPVGTGYFYETRYVTDNNKSEITLSLEKNKTYYIKIGLGLFVTTPVVSYDLDVYCLGDLPLCEHEYTSAVTTAPTCTTDGVRTYTCTLCGSSYTENINALGHDYNAVVTNPTCTTGGYTTYTCTRCGDSNTGSETPASGHRYSSAVTKAATCAAEGVRTYTCSVCGSSYTEAIAKTAHTPQTVTEPATCQATGRQYTKCAVCGETLSAVTVLPKTDHTPAAAVKENETPATCTAAGKYDEVTYCRDCGTELSRRTVDTSALGHSFTKYVYNNDATTERDGTQTAKCDRCSVTDTMTAPGTKLRPPAITIKNYTANKSVDYRASITFTADVKNPVDGAKTHWFIDGKDAGTGDTYTVKEATKDFTLQTKYMQSGSVLAESETETVKVSSGFFARLKAFFRSLFGRLPKVVQEYLGVEIIDRVLP